MDGSTDIPLCDNEPIHIPGSIQPHGIMLVASTQGLLTWQVAGDVEDWLGVADWQGAPLAALIGTDLAARAAAFAAQAEPAQRAPGQATHVGYIGQLRTVDGTEMDVSVHLAGLAGTDAQDMVAVELEPATEHPTSAALLLDRLDEATVALQRATTMESVCRAAAVAFRALIGFDRVLIYRFGDDEAGRVLGEDLADGERSFLNHHFPASDIPRQARALYLRNLVRVIPDIHYTPAPLRPPAPGAPLDMSDSSLRSVSPIHLQYMFNMGMRASASFSIVKDGILWGLVACHHPTPRRIPFELRAAARSLAASLSREIKTKEEADGYRQRLRLRSFEDDVVRLLSREGALDTALINHFTEVQRLMAADGVAVLRGPDLATGGTCPRPADLHALASWVLANRGDTVQSTDRLSEVYPAAAAYAETASGLLSILLAPEEPWLVLWFRAEQVQTLNWAGNPHKEQALGPDETLTPRASFDLWAETVRGRARPWTQAELEGATRLRAALIDVRQNRRLRDLNRQLTAILHDKDTLLQRNEFLMGEVNHRVQNSLQLVGSFLSMQSRNATDPQVTDALDEARRRLVAVGLVHKRLYRGDHIERVDGAHYIEELCRDAIETMGADWRPHLALDLAPVVISTDRAVTLGLVLTELMINVNKYAYAGKAGPIEIHLVQEHDRFKLTVADHGIGRQSDTAGFGSRMMAALVQQLAGTLSYENNRPGTRAVVIALCDAGPR